jgi:predicted enzyme related to lactoylglutathione lyase
VSAADTGTGRVVWHDLLTTEVEKAARFYSELLGWEIGTRTPGETDYPLIEAGGVQHGGFVALGADDGVAPQWLSYVRVADVDTASHRVVELGGEIHKPPTDIPGIGRFAIFGDPHGALLALISLGEDAPPPEGVFLWDELMTTDISGAESFYGDLFGWRCFEDHVGPSGTYRFFQDGDANVAGLMEKPLYLALPLWMTYLAVEDVDSAAERVLELRGTIAVEPTEIVDIGRFAIAVDPTGAVFGLFRGRAGT